MLREHTKYKGAYYGKEKIAGFNSKFDDMRRMNSKHRLEILENYSVEELEALLHSAPFDAEEIDKDIVENILWTRCRLLTGKFEPSPKNILRIVDVSDKFIKAWEEGFIRAKTILEAIYEKEQDKASFMDKYCAKIKLYPEFLYKKNSKTGEWEDEEDIYSIMFSYFESELHYRFEMVIRYDPATKNESDFWNDMYISRKTNWNTFLGVPDYFKDHFLCYQIHELYEHTDWAFQDIAKINNIEIKAIIECNVETGRF